MFSSTETKYNPCSECPYFPECKNPLKGIEHCVESKGMKTFKFGQGCWDGVDEISYVSCSECFHSFRESYESCKAVRKEGELFLKYVKKGVEKDE